MTNVDLTINQGNLRRSDSNFLLRLYDYAREVARSSLFQQERTRAEKALERLTRELVRRKVPL